MGTAFLKRVSQIEQSAFDDPWQAQQIDAYLKQKSTWGYVAMHHQNVVAYVLFNERPYGLKIDRIAVSDMYRRKGAGRALIDALVGEVCLSCGQIRAFVPEENLEAQLFLRACSFFATEPYIVQRGDPPRSFVKMSRTHA
jgi:[ribosomal protein S18]-alanine N-acetyltransferase